MRIGIDVGGTFTDVVLWDEQEKKFFYTKTPSTHQDLAVGVLKGLEEILSISGKDMEDVEYLIHGTAIGTNAIVEGKGAKVGLVTTKGFEDVLEIRRVARPKEAAFDFEADNPPPLVPRNLRKGVEERINSRGEISKPLKEGSVREAIQFFRKEGVDAIAVSLLFSFLNPLHEVRVAEICKEMAPGVFLTLSSEVCPEFREYERTCTTVMNGYLGPVIQAYMDNLVARLQEQYGEVRLHVMQSNGGSMTAQMARDHAAHLINSGPAAGAMATAFLTRLIGHEMAVGADMGGTTFDISLIDKGIPKTTTWGGVTEYPIKLPMVDMKTIGAGGGSIAWVDKGGVLHVGPHSAGSSPGPACYGWGGEQPTVSDANLVLGRLNPHYFLGGKIPLFPEKARSAVKKVARSLGLSTEEGALSIIEIANANMTKGISGISVERGYDLREFILVAFGGAAPNHAASLAAELNIGKVVIPPLCGNLSALGLVVADIQHDSVRTVAMKEEDLTPEGLQEVFLELEREGRSRLEAQGVKDEDIIVTWSADVRYEGQSWELNTPVMRAVPFDTNGVKTLVRDFHALHQKAYSYCEPRERIEIVNARVRSIGQSPKPSLPKAPKNPTPLEKALKETRPVYFREKGWQETPIYDRSLLEYGTHFLGPSVVEEEISTTFVPEGWQGEVDQFGNIVITALGSRK